MPYETLQTMTYTQIKGTNRQSVSALQKKLLKKAAELQKLSDQLHINRHVACLIDFNKIDSIVEHFTEVGKLKIDI